MTETAMPGPGRESFMVPIEIAEAYEERFVPALFADWARPTLAAAGVQSDDHVLDVGCGTGIVARTAAEIVGNRGAVVGADINPAMLTVARRLRPGIQWREADAQALPFPDSSFDRVVCQMALMFFADRLGAVTEMARVTRPGGTVTVMTPATLADQPAWGPFVDAAVRHTGPDAVRLLGTYWSAGDRDELADLFRAAGLDDVDITVRVGIATFPSLDAMITTEVESTPLAARLDPPEYDALRADARTALAAFVTADGRALLPLSGLLATGRRGAAVDSQPARQGDSAMITATTPTARS